MEYPLVSMHTNDQTNFLWGDGFEGVTDVELETLHRKSRDTLLSLEAEFEKRRLPASSQPREIDGQCDSLRKGFNTIEVLERLDDKVLRHCGPELLLLCAACLGKAKVVSLKIEDRVKLLDHLKAKKLSYSSPILRRLATEYNIVQSSVTAELGGQWFRESSSTGPEKRSHIEDGCAKVQLPHHETSTDSQQGPPVSDVILNDTTSRKGHIGHSHIVRD